MKRPILLIVALTAAHTLLANPTIDNIITSLEAIECYNVKAVFTVSLPQLADDVVYDIALYQKKTPADTLMGQSYLIDWTLTGREEPATGFSAYFTGNHYRYSSQRLQEYHIEWDATPFIPALSGSRRSKGVHLNAQFVNILPCSLADELRRMTQSPDYTVTLHPDTLVSGRHVTVISSVMRLDGITAMEAEYTFDPADGLPLRLRMENNPGAVSEQSVAVDYVRENTGRDCPELTETYLMELYPTVFERFRQSNFRIENLPGTKLPAFALPTTTGERYSRRIGEGFRSPTMIVLLDARGGFTPQVVSAIRNAADRLPFPADVIWAFADNNTDAIESVIPQIRQGEHLLMSAAPLIRDCGAASIPAIILADTAGNVADVIIGFNKDLASDVIQKMALVK